MAKKDELGRRGEDVAAEYVEAQGMRVVERNWRCREGEIDVVALDGDEVVVVEVKTRSGTGYGHALEPDIRSPHSGSSSHVSSSLRAYFRL